jgi:hypothetical protein
MYATLSIREKSLRPVAAIIEGFVNVAELVDALDLGSSAERRGGSSPFIRTNFGMHDVNGRGFSAGSRSWYAVQFNP